MSSSHFAAYLERVFEQDRLSALPPTVNSFWNSPTNATDSSDNILSFSSDNVNGETDDEDKWSRRRQDILRRFSTMTRQKPRFMSPTFASSNQQASPQPRSRSVTPGSYASNEGSHKGWVSSAARRVGLAAKKRLNSSPLVISSPVPITAEDSPDAFTRTSQQTPNSQQPVDTATTGAESEDGPSTKTQKPSPLSLRDTVLIAKASSNDKPLPSLPVLNITTGSTPLVARRSLIDASDNRLTKCISTDSAKQALGEKWPVLSPQKTAVTGQSQGPERMESGEKSALQREHISVNDFTQVKSGNEHHSPKYHRSMPSGIDSRTLPKLGAQGGRLPLNEVENETSHRRGPIVSPEALVNDRAEKQIEIRASPDFFKHPRPKSQKVAAAYDSLAAFRSENYKKKISERSERSKTTISNGDWRKRPAGPKLLDGSPIRKRRPIADKQGSPHRRTALRRSPPRFARLLDQIENGSTNKHSRRSSIPLPSRPVQSAVQETANLVGSEAKAELDIKTVKGDAALNGRSGKDRPGSGRSDSVKSLSKFRIKRLSSQMPHHGPVLRISDSAEKLLLGSSSDDEETVSSKPILNPRPKKRNSFPDLRHPAVLKERRSLSASVGLPRSLTRSFTSRSLGSVDPQQPSHEFSTALLLGRRVGEAIDPFMDPPQRLARSNTQWPLKTEPLSTNSEDDEESPYSSPVQMRGETNMHNTVLSPVVESPFSRRRQVFHEATELPGTSTPSHHSSMIRPPLPERTTSLNPPDPAAEGPDSVPKVSKAAFHGLVSHDRDRESRVTKALQVQPGQPTTTSRNMSSSLRSVFVKKSPYQTASNLAASIGSSGEHGSSGTRQLQGSMTTYSNSLPLRKYTSARSRQGGEITPPVLQYATVPRPSRAVHGVIRQEIEEEGFPILGAGRDTSSEEADNMSEDQVLVQITTRVLELAKMQGTPMQKERCLRLGKILVDAINASREAERAAEKAKAEATKAEMQSCATRKHVMEIASTINSMFEEDKPQCFV